MVRPATRVIPSKWNKSVFSSVSFLVKAINREIVCRVYWLANLAFSPYKVQSYTLFRRKTNGIILFRSPSGGWASRRRPVLVSQVNKDSFREEIEDSMATKDSPVLAWATVDGRDIEENIDQENKTIEVNVPVRICYDLFSCQERTVVSDAFSTENELNLTTEAFLSTEVVGMETFDSRIDSSITASEDIPRIDKILAVDGAYLTRTSLTFNDGELSSEGTVHLNIIYLNDEEDSINAVSVEVPYSYNEKLSIQGSNVVATDQIIEIDASVKRGRDIYVDGKIRTQVLVTNEVQTAAISGAELGEKLEERDGALEIYFAQEGKSFWDVAKDLKVSEDALRQQNPEIVEPFEKDEKIVYFEQFEINVD